MFDNYYIGDKSILFLLSRCDYIVFCLGDVLSLFEDIWPIYSTLSILFVDYRLSIVIGAFGLYSVVLFSTIISDLSSDSTTSTFIGGSGDFFYAFKFGLTLETAWAFFLWFFCIVTSSYSTAC